jgi:hypothetical protein
MEGGAELKNLKIKFHKKIIPMGMELFYADGQRDITKLKVSFTILRTRLKK